MLRTLYDLAGRTATTIEDYTNGTPTNDTNKTTQFTYNSAGTTSLTAVLTSSGVQTTGWTYGVTKGSTSLDSQINSNDIAAITTWPDASTGLATNGSDQINVNALGQTISSGDRNGTLRVFTYDVFGRLIKDALYSAGGSNVDLAVRRIETAYDTQGNAFKFTQYTTYAGSTVINEVLREFNGLGQLVAEYQEHSGAVNAGTTQKVQYAYREMDGGANDSRLISMIYPNSSMVIAYNYATGLDDTISRLTSMVSDSVTLESYTYLGLGTVVKRRHPEPDLSLSYIKLSGESNGDAGDKYIGLDRFGRVVDQRWLDGSNDDLDRYQYTYDRNSNRLTRSNVLNNSFDEIYTYDDLNQIRTFDRGSSTLTQEWVYDAVGNWTKLNTDSVTQTRTHNRQNEITGISSLTTPAYDANGNMAKDENDLRYVYDAWNRVVKVKNNSDAVIAMYVYDALNRRVSIDESSTLRYLFYSAAWQLLQERVPGAIYANFVWSPVYIDCMVLRDRSVSGTLDERLYPTNDASLNVTGLVDSSGVNLERFSYTPFGIVGYFDAIWFSIMASAFEWMHLHQGVSLDSISGLYHFRFRDYSATLGRWISKDPLSFSYKSTNSYAYMHQNAISDHDPLGLRCNADDPCPQGTGTCGTDITAHLRKSTIDFKDAFGKLGTKDKIAVCNSAYDARAGWDFSEFAYVDHSEDKQRNIAAPGCGTPPCESNVTVSGKCFFAGHVNYYFWGMLNRACHDFVNSASVAYRLGAARK